MWLCAEGRDLFPPPGGLVCCVEPCLLLSGLPLGVSRHAVLTESAAHEAWLLEAPAGSREEACCTFPSVE